MWQIHLYPLQLKWNNIGNANEKDQDIHYANSRASKQTEIGYSWHTIRNKKENGFLLPWKPLGICSIG